MFARLLNASMPRAVTCRPGGFEMRWTGAATAEVAVLKQGLDCETLAAIVKDVQARALSDRTASVEFDFSRVEQLQGPWGVHFAMLIDLGQRSGLKVSLRGLRRQPLQLVRLFRHTPEVRGLLAPEDDVCSKEPACSCN